MRLFKVYDPNYIDEYSQCLGIWAENEQKVFVLHFILEDIRDDYIRGYSVGK